MLASFALIGITWERLGRHILQRTLGFVLLAMTINMALIRPFIYVFYSSFPPGLALLSMGQFFLEAFTLALLMTFVWRSSQASSERRSTPSVAG